MNNQKTNKFKEYASKIWKFCMRRKWWIIITVIIGVVLIAITSGGEQKNASKFATLELTRGDMRQIVTATGEIRPLNTINVGSQVSGTIDVLYVDYNSRVKKGDKLLEIDPSVLQASVDEAAAALRSAQSQRDYAKSTHTRNKSLFSDGFIARAEMEQSQTNYEQAEQSVKRSASQFERAKTNLGYATIISPIDGTVISRKVDKGQTVAASFQTPNLFEIAEDLSKMQIETSVSEADIGMVKENQTVTFTVDAFPNQKFDGVVRQIRLSPTSSSNVVIYTVVIGVDNSEMHLMPGMTAFVTILIAEKKNVWKIQNSAFLLRNFDGIVQNPGTATTKTHLAIERAGAAILAPFAKGLITATDTEIISDELTPGDRVIVGVAGRAPKVLKVRADGPPR